MLNKTIVLGIAAMLVMAGTTASPASLQIGANLRPSLTITANAFGEAAKLPLQQATVTLASVNPATIAAPALRLPRTGEYGLFGSVALPISALPATKQWKRVSSTDFTNQYGARCTSTACDTGVSSMLKQAALKAQGKTPYEALSLINSSVNNLIRYRPDRGDVWATPVETATSGAGDCEDYAIAKLWLLRSIGYTPDQLQLVVLKDTKTGLYHSVLAVHVGSESYILDNMSSRVKSDTSIGNYVPIESFIGDKSFIHGFDNQRIQSASASTDVAEIQPGT
jgi:predicted transglutaminase-like cysteine proteinase